MAAHALHHAAFNVVVGCRYRYVHNAIAPCKGQLLFCLTGIGCVRCWKEYLISLFLNNDDAGGRIYRGHALETNKD